MNASLNGTCTLLLLLGWWLIRGGNVRGHATVMVLAVVTSAVFLGSYLLYHYQAGSTPFRGFGPVRVVYFTILLSHTILATFGVVPLLALTSTRASGASSTATPASRRSHCRSGSMSRSPAWSST